MAHYTDYVNHMMRLYFKTDGRNLRGRQDDLNYKIVKDIVESKSEIEQAILTDIILMDNPIHVNVEIVAIDYDLSVDSVWEFLRGITDEIASVRGLI